MTAVVNSVAKILGKGAAAAKTVLGGDDFNVLSVLSTGLNLASAGASYFGARDAAGAQLADYTQASTAADFNAQESDLQARQEQVRGRQAANQIMDDLIQTLASQRVGFAANGVDVSFGTPKSVGAQTIDLASKKLDIVQSDSLMSQIAARRQAAAYRQESASLLAKGQASARNTKRAGAISAAGQISDLVNRRIERG